MALFPFLQHSEQINERAKNKPMILRIWISIVKLRINWKSLTPDFVLYRKIDGKKVVFFPPYQSRRTREGVCFSASGLTITECCRAESFDRHFDELLDSGKLQDILLTSSRLEYDIVWKKFCFFVAAVGWSFALRNGNEYSGKKVLNFVMRRFFDRARKLT